MILISAGYFLSFLRTENNSYQHYSNHIGKFEYFEVVVDNLVEEKDNSWKTIGVIRSVISNNLILPASGKILLYFDTTGGASFVLLGCNLFPLVVPMFI